MLPPGSLGVIVLSCEPPVYVSLVHYQAVLRTQRVDPGQAEVTFVLPPDELTAGLAAFRVRVVDAEIGRPIEGAVVVLSGGTGAGHFARADEAGTTAIEGIEPGRYALRIAALGRETLGRSVVVEPGAVLDAGEFALGRETRLAGRVLDADGVPVVCGFDIGVIDLATRTIERGWAPRYASDASGALRIGGLGRRIYVLRASHDGALEQEGEGGATWVSGNVLVDLREGAVSDLVVELKRPTLVTVRVDGGFADRGRYRVLDARGLELAEGQFHGSGPHAVRLPPGSYRLEWEDARGLVLAARSFSVGEEMHELVLSR